MTKRRQKSRLYPSSWFKLAYGEGFEVTRTIRHLIGELGAKKNHLCIILQRDIENLQVLPEMADNYGDYET